MCELSYTYGDVSSDEVRVESELRAHLLELGERELVEVGVAAALAQRKILHAGTQMRSAHIHSHIHYTQTAATCSSRLDL